jgi:FHS family glucose/mannose:H+ symporter-like MFS transporter
VDSKIAGMVSQTEAPLGYDSGWIRGTIVYLGFAATGVGMALPGSVLPTLLAQWSMSDSQAGFLFFVGWLGTSLGALLVRPSRVRSAAGGSALIAAGALGMAYANRWSCFLWMALFGLGLGLTMTSISLLQAARHAQRRGMELNRLNLAWALGASACPSLAAHSLRVVNVHAIFSALGIFFGLFCVWALAREREPEPQGLMPESGVRQRWGIGSLALWPISVVAIILLPTGIESSMGGWIAAYVQRTQQAISTTVTAGTCFWVGLMLSRALSSLVLRKSGRMERFILRQSLATVVAGSLLLIAGTASVSILPGVFLVGFGLGPVYPLLLAVALQYSQNTAIFFVAGLGSAILPWLTGTVSSATSSLRWGLLVPFFASLLMLILGLRIGWKGRLKKDGRPAQRSMAEDGSDGYNLSVDRNASGPRPPVSRAIRYCLSERKR